MLANGLSGRGHMVVRFTSILYLCTSIIQSNPVDCISMDTTAYAKLGLAILYRPEIY